MDEVSATAGLYFPEIWDENFVGKLDTDVFQNPPKENEEKREIPKSNWMVVNLPRQNKLTLKTERVNSV